MPKSSNPPVATVSLLDVPSCLPAHQLIQHVKPLGSHIKCREVNLALAAIPVSFNHSRWEIGMSLALYVALEKEIPGFDASSVCGKLLAKAQRKLDGIARRHGLTPLEDFISTAPEDILAFLEDAGGVPEGVEIPPEEWFEPSDGLRTVRGLLEHLRRDSTGDKNHKGVITDLKATEQVLAAAAEKGVRFHLAIDA